MIHSDTPVKGAFYTCGCYIGGEKLTPLYLIPQKCAQHGGRIDRIVMTEKEARRRATIGKVKP